VSNHECSHENPVSNLIEGIQQKCDYIRETVIPAYDKSGPAGALGKIFLQADIKRGEQAIASGDVVEMLEVYKALEATCESAL
jgi:hypothetical protein